MKQQRKVSLRSVIKYNIIMLTIFILVFISYYFIWSNTEEFYIIKDLDQDTYYPLQVKKTISDIKLGYIYAMGGSEGHMGVLMKVSEDFTNYYWYGYGKASANLSELFTVMFEYYNTINFGEYQYRDILEFNKEGNEW